MEKEEYVLDQPLLVYLMWYRTVSTTDGFKENITISVMDSLKLVFIGVISTVTAATCARLYYDDDYYHDVPTPQIMIGKWVNEDYTSPYKDTYHNGTYNVRYHSKHLT